MNAIANPESAFAAALAAITPPVRTHHDFCGARFPRDPQDIARDRWMAEQLPVRVAALAAQDGPLTHAMDDARATHAMLDAFRANDDAELGRLYREATLERLANAADLALEEDAFKRFPEAR